ncbi:hypothetical protein MJO29_004995 [Puccinia striiformis f. sp. tritici]|uniref:Phospholipid-transporting ATPase n=1 Tax=Puccinia striiformis f. sp. tritici PST-78 TaxID=1165861 RepID=A0A0L0VBY8_9BASI|nr:hypothetical protein Pst134EA_009120 [Puccinia striiformis f. sp. tritici]KAH9457870.1 hypothetical protein Pst134EB_010180 [Puccinia striiformis f. sp. tritici]KAH9468585.1 hypothetical protein Pst134EA_009120 [Puccinia striiformis f. sp. tritici]KAI7959927.1 hypothetical protein MJO29_004995 [Puccinia striiformis f. sp. tritici]KNE96827.1 hypothetical protein PSTG_09962 [Puccinia striiformis f. sp. tritici PST-78]
MPVHPAEEEENNSSAEDELTIFSTANNRVPATEFSNPTPPYGYYPHHSALSEQDEEEYHDKSPTFEQSQNPAAYGGGHPSNPRGTMQDINSSPGQQQQQQQQPIYDPLYEDQSPASANSYTHSAAPFNTSFNHNKQSQAQNPRYRPASINSKYAQADDEDEDDDNEEHNIIHGIRSIPLVDNHPSIPNKRATLKQPPIPKSIPLKERLERLFSTQPKELTGERLLYLNDAARNQREYKFINNHVSTTKYNIISFLPKFLLEQFSKYANLFFLFTACIQQIPNVSPTNPYTTIAPLTLVLLVAAFKEMTEDIKRGKSDAELNSRPAKVLSGDSYISKPWQDIKVGDVVRLESDEHFPADLILLSSSEPDGLAYIETSNLDGETNLKIKQAHSATSHLTSPELASSITGQLRSEQPNNSLYTYEGTMTLETSMMPSKQISISPDQMLLRGAQLRNTAWMYGLVVFTGHETKLMRNATATPIKRTAVERMVNVQIVFLFVILLVLSVGSAIGSFIRTYSMGNQLWYILQADSGKDKTTSFIEDILTFIILYNNLIPISLIVTMEVVKYQQAALINSDLDMYYSVTDTAALCRTSSLVEELGQIDYVFSDKTGTLTCNVMEFRQCSIAGVPYSDVVDENRKGEIFPFTDLPQILGRNDDQGKITNEFLTLLATCHTVIPEEKDGKIIYQASSPDEAALVAGAELLNFKFKVRKPQSILIVANGVQEEYQVLNILEFNSTRKRMSSIIRAPDGRIILYCKGADTVILERCSAHQPYKESTLVHLEEYATEGLRTLCIAMREIPEEEYTPWSAIYERAAATVNGRTEEIDKASELIEKNLFLLGATAIEDKLQEGVPDTIYTLQQAGIKVWVLTGDRQETAINIGLSCRLISESMNLVIVNEETAEATAQFITKRLLALKNSSKNPADSEDLALVIDGKSLGFALDKSISKPFLELAVLCKAVVCCRVSPLQKALVVKLVKKNIKGSITLAIGDGANDVSMIQAAHVGIGISGVEGLQAARSADVAISQFRFLKKLLLVHGTWSYVRLTKLILYSFYKNITLYLIGFYFSFANGFSGQTLFESWTLTFYNVVFTVMPPFVLGVLDQFVSARMLDRYPELYTLGQRNIFFTRRIFWEWVATAVYHSIFIFFVTAFVFKDDLILHQGWGSGQWLWGTTTYLVTLLTVLGKAAIISDLWTKWTLLAIPGSFLLTLFILPTYASTAPHIGVSKEYYGLMPRMLSSSVFYFCLLLIPVGCLARDLAWKGYKRLFRPEAYHIVQEIQKFNLPDYRPRMEQFQKAIKKVRAVQRLRRNRGFAFSQTEEGQEQLIRSYDTTLKKAKG